MVFKALSGFCETGYGNGVYGNENRRHKFYTNYFPKYFISKIINVIPENA